MFQECSKQQVHKSNDMYCKLTLDYGHKIKITILPSKCGILVFLVDIRFQSAYFPFNTVEKYQIKKL